MNPAPPVMSTDADKSRCLPVRSAEKGDRHALPQVRSGSIISGTHPSSAGVLIQISTWCAVTGGFHAVAQGARGAGIEGVGGVEGLAQCGAGDGLAWYGRRVKPDVRCGGRCGANEGVALLSAREWPVSGTIGQSSSIRFG
jgi:hypothetical protein